LLSLGLAGCLLALNNQGTVVETVAEENRKRRKEATGARLNLRRRPHRSRRSVQESGAASVVGLKPPGESSNQKVTARDHRPEPRRQLSDRHGFVGMGGGRRGLWCLRPDR
jgi:hypothetical protein